ncbi:nucleoside deaminase [Acidobacteriota bacterium]
MKIEFMQAAIEEAFQGMKGNEGGPFGAVVVRDGKIIARAHNEVISTGDPTAHAEIQAIRKACKILGGFVLSGCEIYSTCEPCPMCLGAVYWARIPRLYYGCSRADAELIGFSDKVIYDAIIEQDPAVCGLAAVQFARDACLPLMEFWDKKSDKVTY